MSDTAVEVSSDTSDEELLEELREFVREEIGASKDQYIPRKMVKLVFTALRRDRQHKRLKKLMKRRHPSHEGIK